MDAAVSIATAGRAELTRAIGRGVLVKALTTMIGNAALMISTERGLVGLGFILTLGVGCSMLCALVLLPALLSLLGPAAEARVPGTVSVSDRVSVSDPLRRAA